MIDRLSKFIATEPLYNSGEAGEKLVWDAIRRNFYDRQCLCYWRYPIFSANNKYRQEIDILILDRILGLIVIEVKSIEIDRIVSIQGHRWQYQNFYTNFGNPYQQAENQLFSLLEYCQNEPSLHRQITAKALISLPLITEQEWQTREFSKLPSNPPIIFKEDLDRAIYKTIERTKPIIKAKPLNNKQWQLLLATISGTSLFNCDRELNLNPNSNRSQIIIKVRASIAKFDLQQERIGKQIPPGMQRIRGIAGSGKTVILCQKAAFMHLKHPDWKIALVFFSRSLYNSIVKEVDKWLQYFSHNQRKYQPENTNLAILHAWGAKKQPGLYSIICEYTGVDRLTVKDTDSKKPHEALAEVCTQLLKQVAIPQIFDAILIDEGQDLIVDRYKFEDKQPFYWLAYLALRSPNPIHPQQKRLIWAYDESQSLESLTIPTASELFGQELGHLVTGKHLGGINKSEIISRCYRTPHLILTAARALGMGLLRPQGILSGIARKAEWNAIGYQVEGIFKPGRKITVKRPRLHSLNPISDLWQGDLIKLNVYGDRRSELSNLASNIIYNLKSEGLKAERNILVIVLGNSFEAMKLETHVARFLMRQGIDIFIPGAININILQPEKKDPNLFLYRGALTISRIHRAKGQEADLVYLVGLDNIAKDESNIYLRNQLFVALTRSRGWVNLSGIGSYPFYREIAEVIKNKDSFTFTYYPPQREISGTDLGELIARYAKGSRNFQNIDLSNADLAGLNLQDANLIGANLSNANLSNAILDGIKLISADLTNTNLSYASLKKAKLMGANLKNANLKNTNLKDADLTNAQF
ncbi:MAG: pentapeptide repeat-containing protein [Prochloraceae cyanobacterium]